MAITELNDGAWCRFYANNVVFSIRTDSHEMESPPQMDYDPWVWKPFSWGLKLVSTEADM